MADTTISESIQSGAQFARAFLGTALKHSDDMEAIRENLIELGLDRAMMERGQATIVFQMVGYALGRILEKGSERDARQWLLSGVPNPDRGSSKDDQQERFQLQRIVNFAHAEFRAMCSRNIDSTFEFLVDVLLSMLVLAKAGQMAASPSEGQ